MLLREPAKRDEHGIHEHRPEDDLAQRRRRISRHGVDVDRRDPLHRLRVFVHPGLVEADARDIAGRPRPIELVDDRVAPIDAPAARREPVPRPRGLPLLLAAR